ncbi:L-threonylcarbamoyladenylate synthase [Rathayibacter tanaceti]|uniref:Translation factor (SUA5) n=2 Tax=Rathayibacter tanaceti TaxID=1671680 RepID=A0A162GHZ9_9MICO|nr:Sua5/YciO/YrdC/YwlC family protein [Rathayibacter tanaceti]KZX21479.1 yrdC domain protein [Rathayibacter tanaceti]QHC55781.1 translation factor (SUA5) [Rathayibacter tanaceti]TCO39398.1 tRNA A37 threonylcarbamoyladenosine synthetase subunit TsaC/SUA5/YrdC [Rathayibacter tanaceti]
MTSTTVIEWREQAPEEAVDALSAPGGLVVCATKVGYILMTTDGAGLERKFSAKQRNRNKPGVVLCSSIEQLTELAELNDEILAFYQKHWDEDILLGCILPWKESAVDMIDEDARELVRDKRGTSCFVIRFGRPAEQLVTLLWERDRTLSFASSANPSGVGNRGRVANIGERIENEADVIVAADGYVASIQPGKDEDSRHEQGVMVSLVDASGTLIPEQRGERSITPGPVLIRRGLDYERIMLNLAEHFNSWDYRQGEYY